MQPLVSVIMGTYNCKNKKMLIQSVDSILTQTFCDFEFIICDDGSTDDTAQYLQQIEKMDSRVVVIYNRQNRGLASALNTCIEKSKGQYIARQDDDDISYKWRLERQVNFIKKHSEYSIVGALADVYDENGIWGEYKVQEQPSKKDFLWNSPFIHPVVLIRKEALINVGKYRISKETRRCEDYDLFMRMYSQGYIGYNIQEKLYKYRIEESKKKYRPMKYRLDEMKVRAKGFHMMKLGIASYPYIIKPVIIGLIPQEIFKKIRRNQY